MPKLPTPVQLLILALMTIVAGILSLSLGSVAIPPLDVWHSLTQHQASQAPWVDIIWQFRVPKALTACAAGIALGLSGLQMQTLFQNPLADPSILGINAGASLGVALALLTLGIPELHQAQALMTWTNLGVVVASSFGSVITLAIVLLVSYRVQNSVVLLIFGLMFGYITSALVTVLLQFSSLTQTQQYLSWTFGSFGGVTWTEWPTLGSAVAIGSLMALALAQPLNLLLLGDDQARTLGLPLQPVRLGVILSAGILTGAVTAFCGPISFLGVAVPHLARQLLQTVDHWVLMPATALLGATIALLGDCVAQLPGQDGILPLNAVMVLLGAPMVIWVIFQRYLQPPT